MSEAHMIFCFSLRYYCTEVAEIRMEFYSERKESEKKQNTAKVINKFENHYIILNSANTAHCILSENITLYSLRSLHELALTVYQGFEVL
jgi:predicted DNA repair protein MutK